MRRKPIPPGILLTLIAIAVMLPMGIFVILGLSLLLSTMGDESGQVGAVRIAVGCGGLWVFDLICLILVLAINSLAGPDDPTDTP